MQAFILLWGNMYRHIYYWLNAKTKCSIIKVTIKSAIIYKDTKPDLLTQIFLIFFFCSKLFSFIVYFQFKSMIFFSCNLNFSKFIIYKMYVSILVPIQRCL